MRKFDYFFLNNGLLTAKLVNLTANISSLKIMAGVRKDEYVLCRILAYMEAHSDANVNPKITVFVFDQNSCKYYRFAL